MFNNPTIYYKIKNSKIIIHKLIRLLLYILVIWGRLTIVKRGRLTIWSPAPFIIKHINLLIYLINL